MNNSKNKNNHQLIGMLIIFIKILKTANITLVKIPLLRVTFKRQKESKKLNIL
jgi:hypothetical protein